MRSKFLDVQLLLIPFENTREQADLILSSLGERVDVLAGMFDERFFEHYHCSGMVLSAFRLAAAFRSVILCPAASKFRCTICADKLSIYANTAFWKTLMMLLTSLKLIVHKARLSHLIFSISKSSPKQKRIRLSSSTYSTGQRRILCLNHAQSTGR